MDARQERVLQLAQRGDITKHAGGWKVLSQTGNGSYFVHMEDRPSCVCPDYHPLLHNVSRPCRKCEIARYFAGQLSIVAVTFLS
jgi:hypothetical protein